MRWTRIAAGAVYAIAGLLVLVTALSAIESNEWWIRIWDFPRVQILVGLAVAAIAIGWIGRRWRWPALGLLALAAAWQVYRILPYTPFASREVAFADDAFDAKSCFSVLSLNVYQYNTDYARTIALIDREDPDILLLLETGSKWAVALEPVLRRYPHRVDRPLDNTYGLMFATRLPMTKGRIGAIIEKETPSVFASLTTRGGTPFNYIGLHPRPPLPGQDTEARDAEIAIAAGRARAMKYPVLAGGDFNDVAWSHTSQLFKRIGGYLDPRIGRGTYPTFPAGYPGFRWPLDHLFFTPEFRVRSLGVGASIGSDHLPVTAVLCLGDTVPDAPAPKVSTEDRKDAREILNEYRETDTH
ncbi:endonuclease/exonuclease/phosphatase family protein [Sphingomonas sp. Leaf17]|uniref:endonuclease/exonuclease/phosphatase family protein n=1 Tax=Sphingomonas sp. Leaf17 TaxID=1735683 RepID=UPI000AFAB44F|nr:endonuclease/exonuclease/phosphatase family protein [Sphingomonas sp. Leaf17]